MIIHPRIHERHPEISEADIRHAWSDPTDSVGYSASERELRVGFDLRGRELEMIGALTEEGWLVYHAFTPPTKKFRREIAELRRRM